MLPKVSRIPYLPTSHEQREDLISLLTEAFGPHRPYYEAQISTVASPQSTLLLGDERGRLISHIQIVPYFYKGEHKGAYLYALCTRSEYRGMGIMEKFLSALLSEELQAKGYSFACLLPASLPLIGYYERLGFQSMRGGTPREEVRPDNPLILPGKEARAFNKSAQALDRLLYGEETEIPGGLPWMLYSLGERPQIPSQTDLIAPML